MMRIGGAQEAAAHGGPGFLSSLLLNAGRPSLPVAHAVSDTAPEDGGGGARLGGRTHRHGLAAVQGADGGLRLSMRGELHEGAAWRADGEKGSVSRQYRREGDRQEECHSAVGGPGQAPATAAFHTYCGSATETHAA